MIIKHDYSAHYATASAYAMNLDGPTSHLQSLSADPLQPTRTLVGKEDV
jgi:hypothetical protein